MNTSIFQEDCNVPFVATLANRNAIPDLQILLSSLAIWNEVPPVIFLYCDEAVDEAITLGKIAYPGKIMRNIILEKYGRILRPEMEKTPGKRFSTLWMDFMTEKILLLEWANSIKENPHGIFLMDSDICFTAPLPSIPVGKKVALSPHYIKPGDTDKYGYYNGGFCWTKDSAMPKYWMEACKTARYFEQSALEEIPKKYNPEEVYEFPIQVNYGWWRMFQAEKNPIEVLRTWSYDRIDRSHSGLTVEGKPVVCVHTHFYEKYDQITKEFNNLFLQRLSLCTRNLKTAKLAHILATPSRALL